MRVGLLNAYDNGSGEPHKTAYEPIVIAALKKAFDVSNICTFEVAQGEFPLSVTECQLWVLSGSPSSVYDKEPWIDRLSDFVLKASQADVKILGFCFGHQMIAYALGGKVKKSEKGWGVGIREFKIQKKMPWMKTESSTNKARLIMSHQDQVTELPKGAEVIAQSDFCPFEMYIIGEKILSMQGHPEFTTSFAKIRLETRAELLGKPLYDKALASLSKTTTSEEVWNWIKKWSVF